MSVEPRGRRGTTHLVLGPPNRRPTLCDTGTHERTHQRPKREHGRVACAGDRLQRDRHRRHARRRWYGRVGGRDWRRGRGTAGVGGMGGDRGADDGRRRRCGRRWRSFGLGRCGRRPAGSHGDGRHGWLDERRRRRSRRRGRVRSAAAVVALAPARVGRRWRERRGRRAAAVPRDDGRRRRGAGRRGGARRHGNGGGAGSSAGGRGGGAGTAARRAPARSRSIRPPATTNRSATARWA